MAAILQMSLADGLAAVVGVKYGKGNEYHALGHVKSKAGTIAFFVTSLVILIAYGSVAKHPVGFAYLIILPLIASVAENFGAYGFDNVFVPLFICFMLQYIA